MNVIAAKTGYGEVGFGFYLGYQSLQVSNFLRCQSTISAHADSKIEIITTESVSVVGFLNGTASSCAGVEFWIDGVHVGATYKALDHTALYNLAPGRHILEAKAIAGNGYCHTVWGFEPETALLEHPTHYVAVGAICKDENTYLAEWVRHHLSIGVSHFYLLDNESAKPLAQTIREEGLEQWVTVEQFPTTGTNTQNAAYLYLTQKYAAKCQWMALIDIDEFIVPKLGHSLPKLLSAFEDFGGLRVRWVMFGSDGLRERPRSQLETFQSSYIDPHVKMIVQPRFVAGIPNAHRAEFMTGMRAVGEHFDDDASTEHIQINHYWTRSEAEWEEKIARGAVVPGYERNWEDFHRHQERCQFRDLAIQKLWKAQKQRIEVNESIPIIGYIHVCAVNHWQAILRSQLKKCRDSGLYEKTSAIKVGIVGATEEILPLIKDLPEKVSVMFCDPNLGVYEFRTLKVMQEDCRNELHYVWYIHTKGVTNPHSGQHGWRSKMEEFILIHHEIARNRLDWGFGAAGGFGSGDRRWHLPGNFWWTRSDHLRALPLISSLNWADRFAAEFWIGTNGRDKLYLHDYGDTQNECFTIKEFNVGAGMLTTGGSHGWARIPVLIGKNVPEIDYTISAHVPSRVVIQTTRPAIVVGFVCGSGNANGWRLNFRVNQVCAGVIDRCNQPTPPLVLSPGAHELYVQILEGEIWGAHSMWGLAFPE